MPRRYTRKLQSIFIGTLAECFTDPQHIRAVDEFNRFFESQVRRTMERILCHEISWTEWRVLRFLGEKAGGSTVAQVRERLAIDSGYLSRIVQLFRAYDLVVTQRWSYDRRFVEIELTPFGRRTFSELAAFARESAALQVHALGEGERRETCDALRQIQHLLAVAGRRGTATGPGM